MKGVVVLGERSEAMSRRPRWQPLARALRANNEDQ